MKKLITLAAIMGVTAQAHAQGSSEFSHNAEFRARYQFDQNINGIDNDPQNSQDAFEHRFKLDTAFRASEQFSAHLSLIHNAGWGLDIASPSATDAVATNNGITDSENMILVQEAFGHWMINDSFSIKFGRQNYQIADGSVIGINDWQRTPYSFEGGLLTYEMEHVKVDAFGYRLAEYGDRSDVAEPNVFGMANPNSDPENNLMGLSVDLKTMPEWLKMVNIHVLQNNVADRRRAADDPNTAINESTSTLLGKTNLLRYGAVVSGDAMNIDYKLNYNAHTGQAEVSGVGESELDGNMIQAELGYTLPELMNSRVYVLYHQSSGADANGEGAYDPFLYELHHNAGRMDVFQWGNLSYIQLGYHLMPTDSLKVGLDYIMFSRTEKTDGANFGRFGSALGRSSSGYSGRNGAATTTLASMSDKLGDEIDLIAEKSYDNGLTITGRAGMFMPGDFFSADVTGLAKADKTYTQIFLEARMNF